MISTMNGANSSTWFSVSVQLVLLHIQHITQEKWSTYGLKREVAIALGTTTTVSVSNGWLKTWTSLVSTI
jgi:hypothetical protein